MIANLTALVAAKSARDSVRAAIVSELRNAGTLTAELAELLEADAAATRELAQALRGYELIGDLGPRECESERQAA